MTDLQPLADDVTSVLRTWPAPNSSQEQLRVEYLGFLAQAPAQHTLLKGQAEHLTASTLIISAEGTRVLLTLHRKAGRWLQTGGHCEATDRSVAGAALREAAEESGIHGLALLPGPVLLDRHDLTPGFGICRVHWDIRYIAVAPADAATHVSAESVDLRWFAVDDVPSPPGERLAELAACAAALVRAEGR